MRATAVLRRPVPKYWTIPATQIPFFQNSRKTWCGAGWVVGWRLTAAGKTFGTLRYRQSHRLLRLVGMLVACIDLQLAIHLFAELVLREHSRDGVLDHSGRVGGAHFGGTDFGEAARVTGVAAIQFLAFFAAGELHFRRIDDDHVVAGAQEGGVRGLALAPHVHARG